MDSSHAIFHRTNPRLTLSEMTGSLPCNEDFFENAVVEPLPKEAWLQSASKITSLEGGISILIGDKWTSDSVSAFGHLSHLDLFALVSGMLDLL